MYFISNKIHLKLFLFKDLSCAETEEDSNRNIEDQEEERPEDTEKMRTSGSVKKTEMKWLTTQIIVWIIILIITGSIIIYSAHIRG